MVDKPPGLVVIPARGEPPEQSLRHVVERQIGRSVWVVHRLDRGTTGVVVFAKTDESHRRLNALFAKHEVRKKYLAFTRGLPRSDSGTISVALHTARKGKMRPAKRGEPDSLPSQTRFQVLERFHTPVFEVGFLELEPRTGRSHQIRVHLRFAEAPLLVDPLYGRSEQVTGTELGLADPGLTISRLTLHASCLELPAKDGSVLRFESPLPEDLSNLLTALRRHRAPQERRSRPLDGKRRNSYLPGR